jgi:uncharacterized repeat protein (TIGR01451 family)
MKRLYNTLPTLLITLIVGLMTTSTAFGTATIVIQNNDDTGVGFNDPTPVDPVGGNPGMTLGQQRLNAFEFVANIWGATLTSGPTITIGASWAPLSCTANSGALGSAGNAGNIFRDFPGFVPGTWYGNALANALRNVDGNGATQEINAQFNVNLGTPGCLETLQWYYGLDTNAPPNGINLVTVLLHEFAHGLGFQTFTNRSSGAQIDGFPSIYDRFLLDNTTGKTWPQMTDAERVASAINTGNLVWNGPQVVSDVPNVLGTPRLRVNSPPAIAGDYLVGTADFGARLTTAGVTGGVIQALDTADGAGPATTDGCSPLTNAAAVSGKIALIDRGTCTFVVKVKNAQNAGAIGVLIADDAAGSPPPGLGGSDPTITIPAVRITLADGNTIKTQLASGVTATLLVDGSTPAGADSSNRPRMYTPNPLEGGSSVSHWDTSLFPNQLMEPSINSDLSHSVLPPEDLTFSLLRDIGWPSVDLAISKSHSGNFAVGTNGTYTINVLNSGSAATTGTATLTDTLPAGLGFVSGTGTGWSCSAVGQVVTCTHAGSIPAGNSVEVDVVVSVAAAATPSVINTASVSTTGDVNAANNTANDTTFVVGDNHLVQIRQIMTGANNNAAVQFVETRMSDATQNLWSNRVKLVFFDAAGTQTGEFIVPGNPPGGTNRSVLFATQAFANLPGAPVPDFIFPGGLLQPASGKVCFKNTADLSAVAVSICLSYGSFTGDTEGGGSPAPALAIAGARSLKRLVANAGAFGGPPTDNPGSNQNSHFAIADALPENSGGPSAPMSFFLDVPGDNFARQRIQALSNAGVTAGCGAGNYCPDNNVTREQMSIFIIRAMGQTPVDPPTGEFSDVPLALFPFSAGFIERMKVLGITAGCGGTNFCPGSNVSREQMSIFIIRAMGQTPVDPATGEFADVPPASFPFSAGFIEKMKLLGITAGCGGLNFCPGNNVTRAQMAIFLQKAFSLPIPP